LLPEKASFFTFQIEHIVSIKHGGESDSDNLAFSCPICNRNKGTELGALAGVPPKLIRLYNPRTDTWTDHFSLNTEGKIEAKTLIGEATVFLLDLNNIESINDRKKLINAGEIALVL
jgi:5-methylcytosine-specific restriction endonuclease McrA